MRSLVVATTRTTGITLLITKPYSCTPPFERTAEIGEKRTSLWRAMKKRAAKRKIATAPYS